MEEASISKDNLFPEGVLIPQAAVLERIESSYGPLAEAVKCGLCGTPHQKGFVVEFRETECGELRRALLGHNCGEREFGATWAHAVVKHNQEVRAAEIRGLFRTFLQEATEIQPKLDDFLRGLKARKAVREDILISAPEFMHQCQVACRHYRGQLNPDSGGPKHILTGQLFFLQDTAAGRTKFILSSIRNARKLAEDTDVDVADIAVRLDKFDNLKQELADIEKEAAAGRMALQQENMRRAIDAVNWNSSGSRIKLDGSHLYVWQEIGLSPWRKVIDLRRLPA